MSAFILPQLLLFVQPLRFGNSFHQGQHLRKAVCKRSVIARVGHSDDDVADLIMVWISDLLHKRTDPLLDGQACVYAYTADILQLFSIQGTIIVCHAGHLNGKFYHLSVVLFLFHKQ